MNVSQITDPYDIQHVVPFFQPIIDLHNMHVWRYECLARLLSFNQRPFIPSQLLYLVDRQHCPAQLTERIFNRSASYFRDINMPWNINISQADMQDNSIRRFLAAQVENYPNPQRIALEVTAGNALAEPRVFAQFCGFCQQLGIGIFLDNVGEQVADLQGFAELPISGIKLAGQLTGLLVEQVPQATELVESLQIYAQANGINLIAQHVEDEASADLIQRLGIKYAQGFYFSEPEAQPQ